MFQDISLAVGSLNVLEILKGTELNVKHLMQQHFSLVRFEVYMML